MFGILAVGILMLVFIVNVMHNLSNLIMLSVIMYVSKNFRLNTDRRYLFLYLHQISNVNENLLFFSIIIPTQLIHVSLYFFMLTITQTLLILVSQDLFIITIIPTFLILVSHDYFTIALLISLNITTLRKR